MCGFSGFFSSENINYVEVIKNMTNEIVHRGPDATKYYINKDLNFYAGFNRLSIIDLSMNAMQPMNSFDNKLTIFFNGEIYNFKELKTKLLENFNSQLNFKSSSDTEVLVNCFSIMGINKTLDLINGQFAIALWNNEEKNLFLMRDCFGEKPIYYGNVNNSFVFSSELKSILKFPNFNNNISKKSLEYYFRFLSVPSPHSIFENIFKIQPGEVVKLNFKKDNYLVNFNSNTSITKFWKTRDIVLKSKNNNNLKNDYINNIEKKIRSSIDKQAFADVPVACLLSGGIDSSLICALYQTQSKKKINTFTIGFKNQSYNESIYASKIANYLKTNHNEIILDENKGLDIVSNISNIYSEPFSDSSQIPSLLVCNEISKHYKVALSGDGGDEIFGGYNRYIWIQKLWKIINFFPYNFRKYLFSVIQKIPLKNINMIFYILKLITLNFINVKFAGQKLKRMSNRLVNVQTIDELFMFLISEWTKDENLILDHKYDNNVFYNYYDNKKLNIQEKMMLHDTENYLPNDILVKTDIASMANSLEIRSPFLNKEIFETAWELPLDKKIKNNKGKKILYEILKKYLPEKFIDRPKQGFAVPIDHWLRSSLHNWGKEIIFDPQIKRSKLLNHKLIEKKWNEHQIGVSNWGQSLWSVIVFQQWLNKIN